ncbi:NmrA domain-containing protein [Mycena venus]|uniref:NmrA domain-containing protein n=1 Tax=Mycena venus TaxID=2733690 RepID=A0A8H7D327_9AGAR|nr:NmrA domain-containing protein [Mycena venus]
MSSYKSFAVIGAGALGSTIVAAFVAQNLPVVVLARPGSKSTDKLPAGAKLATIDTSDAAAVAAVFKEHTVDVVLSTLTGHAISAQKSLIEAAKAANIKLFVPSEYGVPTEGLNEGTWAEKNQIAEQLKSAGIPSLRIYNGLFTEYIPWLFLNEETKKIHIVGKGEAPLSTTALPDVAGFVVHVLTTLPSAELENKIFRIEGERTKANDLGALFKTAVEYVTEIPGEMGDIKTAVATEFDSGLGSTGWSVVTKSEGTGDAAAGSANKLWPGHHWKTIKEVHGL